MKVIKNIVLIAKRDFRAYFTSPIAYIIISGFMVLMGWMFFAHLDHFNRQSLQFQQGGKGMSIVDGIIRPLYGNMNVIFLFLVPFITMRLFAEEKKQHTIELLLTAPVSLLEIILGKFFSSFFLVLVMLALTTVYPVVLCITGNPDLGPIVANYIGTVLLVGCYISVGVLFSSVTENQIVAGALSFSAALFLWLISWATYMAGPVWGEILMYLSLISHYNNFGSGLLMTSDIFFYLSFIAINLFLTHKILDSFRWR